MARKVRKKPGKKLSTAAWFGIGCGGVIVLGLIIAGVVYFMLTGEPALPPEATATASTSESSGESPRASSRSAPPLERQVEYVEQAARSEEPVPVTMTIRESELNEMIRREATGEVRDLNVYFGDGTIAATGRTDYRGQTVHLTIRARPVVSGGELAVQVEEVMIGRLQAPASIHDELQAELDRGLQRAVRDGSVQVNDVQVSPDVMTISGRVGGR
ncbi:MAG: hypothetical protein R6V07_13215 [Armatimonadota bacterium]